MRKVSSRSDVVPLVVIDGDHSTEQSLEDFELYSTLVRSGFVVFHDATNPDCGVAATLTILAARGHRLVTVERDVGLALLEIPRAPPVEEVWDYLCTASDRGERLMSVAGAVFRAGDRVLDAYCGCSPLGPLLADVELVGWDRDPLIVDRLRREFPQHRWERIEERALPFSGVLPDAVDVLLARC